MRGRSVEIEKRKKEMRAPIIHLLLDEQTLTDLCRRCDETSHAETCTRFQMLYLLALLPQADLYLQNGVQFVFYPILTRAWCSKGRHGQRLVEASVDNRQVYGFGLVDWRDGIVAPGRIANVFCEQD